MIETILEDTRMALLVSLAIVLTIAGFTYRLWPKPRPLELADRIRLCGLVFQQTCPASPEQYDVYLGNKMIGYVRYRFGNLYADYPDVDCETVFERTLEEMTGQMTAQERGEWLPVIARRLRRRARIAPFMALIGREP